MNQRNKMFYDVSCVYGISNKMLLAVIVCLPVLTVAQPRVTATAPVQEIEEGAILSLHCQVWELQPGLEVTIMRITGRETKFLSVDETLMNVPDSVFLATRHVSDGSIVYFLSIIDVQRSDAGKYSCKVLNKTETISEVAEDFVRLEIMYFPGDTDPACQQEYPKQVEAGTEIQLNCNSEVAKPPVSLTWTKTGSEEETLTSTSVVKNNRLFSSLTVRLNHEENNVIFMCHLRSEIFVDKHTTCHIGPIRVTPTPDKNNKDKDVVKQRPNNKQPEPTGVSKVGSGGPGRAGERPNLSAGNYPNLKKLRCEKTCSYFESPVNRWIMATVVAGLMTFVFFIFGIVLFYKYYQVHSTSAYVKARRVATRTYTDEIYSELEARRPDTKDVYMSLNKHDIMDSQLHQMQQSEDIPEHYHDLPKQVKQ